MATVDTTFWCERVRTCFSMFVKRPSTLQHLLLFGPPGSGKTTSAAWLVDQIWGARKSLMCISMNAADERSLESIRQKVFPFLRVDWRADHERGAPRFLILDECETLTEAAHLSLQTMMNACPTDLCVILICNSQSRIHPKLRQRLLKVRYDPPTPQAAAPTVLASLTRGDLRQQQRSHHAARRLWTYLHGHPLELAALLSDETADYHAMVTEILLLADTLRVLDRDLLDRINCLYPLLAEGNEAPLLDLLRACRHKFDTHLLGKRA